MNPGEIVQAILKGRGILGDAAALEFLSDRPRLTYDPLLFEDMEAGASMLLAAVTAGRRVCAYGDYDVDGVCATALLCRYLRGIGGGEQIQYYIPDRTNEGYGLNKEALAKVRSGAAFADGIPADLVVTVDCGSVSVSEAAYAQEIGLDIIITDHHDLAEGLAPGCVFLNPKRGGYPFTKLCGAGVAFKLCSAVENFRVRETGGENRSILQSLVDLVCIATIADVMPLIDENRTLVKYGLGLIRSARRPALAAIFKVAGIDPAAATVRDIAFGIAPRINAAGRLGDAAEAVALFLTDDEVRMREGAAQLDRRNAERRHLQDECLRECLDLAEAERVWNGVERACFLMLEPDAAHEGISGIVAGKVREATGLPCAVLAKTKDGELKGSARSAGRLDVTALLRGRAGYFLRLGGHAAAAGFSLRKEDALRAKEDLTKDLLALLEADPEMLHEETHVDLRIESSDITPALAEALVALAPFGQGNPIPALAFRAKASIVSSVKAMGGNGVHVRFRAADVPCVWFSGTAPLTALLDRFPDEELEFVGCPEINVWNGRKSLQFTVSLARPQGVV
ncbi:single-stranded-DNA-specific exonuclease RecJ [Clostridia bacterium]|nr:single-stranded-DNA-specific exonuclease RecJ [Clostridia bacterium]